MIKSGWLVRHVLAELPEPRGVLPLPADFRDDWARWLDRADIPVGTPFLISPEFEYDVALNAFFCCPSMVGSARTTQTGYAQDLGKFLTFLWTTRGGRSWRDATEADHTAYLYWRRFDPAGPRIGAQSWDREVAAVNRFYCWQVRAGNVAVNPIPQRQRRAAPIEAGGSRRGAKDTPATYSHGAGREKIEWFPAAAYRRWRDVGMRGYRADGLPDPRFRGRWAARNTTFCDLMVRTGLRLSEQAALTVFEIPLARDVAGYRRFWLPPAIAKGGSARWVYIPGPVIADLVCYATIDRAEVIAAARADGRYQRLRQPLVMEDPDRPVVTVAHPGGGGHRVKVSQLDPAQRCRLLVDGPDGLAPAAYWLCEHGLPVAVSTWKGLFAQANARCAAQGLQLHGHAHLLRHTFAVITLEQLQRGHIAALAELDAAQRGHYTRVFGDPLDWVRRRLGHRSVTTTMIYLHALAELEMETRLALVPDGWEHPGQIAPWERDQSMPVELDGV
jgi:site-specific recombinase XerD